MRNSPPESPVTVCTLWEKDYHKGVGVLVNSLARAGYQGRVWAGYRGDLPPWAKSAVTQTEVDTSILSTGVGIDVVFKRIDSPVHFAQLKAGWMSQILDTHSPHSNGVYYFDPDIIVLASWRFFENWIRYGIAVCEDSHYPLNETHPIVQGWKEYARNLGYAYWNPKNVYLNSGMVGVARREAGFLNLWEKLTDSVNHDFNQDNKLKIGDRSALFHGTDQDTLTLASYVSECPISYTGVDGMGFNRGLWLIQHEFQRKTWRRRLFRDLLSGRGPDAASRLYWDLAGSPIEVEVKAKRSFNRLAIPIAAGLNRFYGRR